MPRRRTSPAVAVALPAVLSDTDPEVGSVTFNRCTCCLVVHRVTWPDHRRPLTAEEEAAELLYVVVELWRCGQGQCLSFDPLDYLADDGEPFGDDVDAHATADWLRIVEPNDFCPYDT